MSRDQILSIIRLKGPVTPTQIAKEIGTDTLIASAHLSELSSNKKLIVSRLKVGGTPLYYLQGQEEKLETYISNLEDVEIKAFNLLKHNGILKDSEQEPAIRVALREIKDFATPLHVTIRDQAEIFWKFYNVNDIAARELIEKILKPTPIKKEIEKQEPEEQITENTKPIKETEKTKSTKIRTELPEQKKTAFKQDEVSDKLYNKVKEYFDKNNIEMFDYEILKKDSEATFTIKIPSVLGGIRYYCIAKKKSRLNEQDATHACLMGHHKKMPVLLLYQGIMNKKADELILKDYKNLIAKKI